MSPYVSPPGWPKGLLYTCGHGQLCLTNMPSLDYYIESLFLLYFLKFCVLERAEADIDG